MQSCNASHPSFRLIIATVTILAVILTGMRVIVEQDERRSAAVGAGGTQHLFLSDAASSSESIESESALESDDVQIAPLQRQQVISSGEEGVAARYKNLRLPSGCSVKDLSKCKVTMVTVFCDRIDATLNAVQSVVQQTHANLELVMVMVDDAPGSLKCPLSLEGMRARIATALALPPPPESAPPHTPFPIGTGKTLKLFRASECDPFRREREGVAEMVGFACDHVEGAPGFMKNMGVLESMVAKSDFVAFLDDDDCAFPTRVRTQLKWMLRYDAVYSCADIYLMRRNARFEGRFDEEGVFHPLDCAPSAVASLRFASLYGSRIAKTQFPGTDQVRFVPLEAFRRFNPGVVSTSMLRVDHLARNKLWFDPRKRLWDAAKAEDWDYWTRVLEQAAAERQFMLYVDKRLGVYDTAGGRPYPMPSPTSPSSGGR